MHAKAASKPNVLRGLSVYQDMVVRGQTVLTGRRDCLKRWEAIAPHLPAAAAILDVGSNFGWFGLKACETSKQRIVASVEADERSAQVQRLGLASHAHERIVLLTRRAGAGMASTFATADQWFDVALCLSVLHWIPDHEEFLRVLGSITGRLFVEQPDPQEEGAGCDWIRRRIGPIGDYLTTLFPNRPCVRLTQSPSHRGSPYPREIWLVGEPRGGWQRSSAGLDVAALLQLSPSWPPRCWWQRQMALASAVAWARVERGRHFPSDVLAGAALGHFLSAFCRPLLACLPF